MKRLLVLSICNILILLFGGCRSSGSDKSGIEVSIDGDGRFPSFIVGTWKADQGGWEIVFEPDGKISSAVVSLGRVRMKPGQVTTKHMKLGGKGIFKPGLWTVQYSQAKRELIVEITIENFRVELGENIVQGQTRDFFVGMVSADGRFWWAERFTFPEYIVDTDKYSDYELSFNPDDNPREELVFQKVAE